MVDAIVLFFEHDFFKLLDAQQTTEQEEFRINLIRDLRVRPQNV